jgi:hypothetical protein
MSNQISFFSNEDIYKHVKTVMSHTNYTEPEAIDKLKLFNSDYMRVIKDYMGIPEQKEQPKLKSVNQEIYKQLRTKLDTSMKEYREQNPINMEQAIANFIEEEEKEK